MLLSGIMSALPKKMESTLNLHKSRLLGSLPKERDDFDPLPLLTRMEGGEKILVLDSKKDLPSDWRSRDMKDVAGLSAPPQEHPDGPDILSTDDAASSDTGASSDDGQEAEVESDNEYQDVSMSSMNIPEATKEPKRVLVFTTMILLGMLALAKHGSVDGTFKAMTKKWKQLFVFMVEWKDVYHPVAFGWLPDKNAISYHVFLFLLMNKFRESSGPISDYWGRSTLKLKKIKLDFEVAIHRAFEILFKLRGCFFHFSQACWRQVQKGGVVVAYMCCKDFRDFVRSVVALPFLPLNQIEAALDDLKLVSFDKESPYFEESVKFQEKFIQYVEDVWLYGNYPPKMWNQWKKTKNLTNNHNEGYNSRINKIISVTHPNPWVLVCQLQKELLRAEGEVLYLKVSFCFALGIYKLEWVTPCLALLSFDIIFFSGWKS